MSMNDEGFLSSKSAAWIAKHRRENPTLFQIVDDLNRTMVKMLHHASPKKDQKRELLVAVLFARVVEHFQSAIVLAERGAIPSGRAMVRVLCDATFAIRACAKKPEYADKIILDDRVREKQLVDALVSLPRKDVAVPPEEMEKLERRLSELRAAIKADNQGVLKSIDTADAAGLVDFYRLFYVPCSNAIHSAARDLDDHIVKDKNGDVGALRWGPLSRDVEHTAAAAVQIAFAAANGHLIVFPNATLERELETLWERQKRYLRLNLSKEQNAGQN